MASSCPASGRFPPRWAGSTSWDSTRWWPIGSRPGCRSWASASAFSCCFERSTELGGADGLGAGAGRGHGARGAGLKLPHIGWEPVRWESSSELTEGLATETPFYFVHSFAVRPREQSSVLGTAAWGERFACAVARPPLYGVQFHPEKSSAAGLRLLANFAEICAAVPA